MLHPPECGTPSLRRGLEPAQRPCSHRRKEEAPPRCVSTWVAPEGPDSVSLGACSSQLTGSVPLPRAGGIYALEAAIHTEPLGAALRLGPYFLVMGREGAAVSMNASSIHGDQVLAFGGSPGGPRSKPCTEWGVGRQAPTQPPARGAQAVAAPQAARRTRGLPQSENKARSGGANPSLCRALAHTREGATLNVLTRNFLTKFVSWVRLILKRGLRSATLVGTEGGRARRWETPLCARRGLRPPLTSRPFRHCRHESPVTHIHLQRVLHLSGPRARQAGLVPCAHPVPDAAYVSVPTGAG